VQIRHPEEAGPEGGAHAVVGGLEGPGGGQSGETRVSRNSVNNDYFITTVLAVAEWSGCERWRPRCPAR